MKIHTHGGYLVSKGFTKRVVMKSSGYSVIFLLQFIFVGFAFSHGGHSHNSSSNSSGNVSRPSVSSSVPKTLPPTALMNQDMNNSSPVNQTTANATDFQERKKWSLIYTADFTGPSVSNPTSSSHFTPDGTVEKKIHIVNSIYGAFYTAENFNLFVNPRFDYHPFAEEKQVENSKVHQDSLVVENLLVGGAWSNVYAFGPVVMSNLMASIELPLNHEWQGRGMIFAPGVFTGFTYPLQNSRLSFGLDTLFKLYFYKGTGDINLPSENPDVLGYFAPSANVRTSEKTDLRLAYEMAGYYYRNRPDFTFANDQTDLKLSFIWKVSQQPFASVTPYVLFYPGNKINGDTTALGLEVSVVAL